MPIKKLALFKCDWFDNTNKGEKVDNQYGMVQVRQSRRYRVYKSFIFAQKVEQVYYTPYHIGHCGWLVVIKTKAHCATTNNIFNKPDNEVPYQDVHQVHDLHVILPIDADNYDNSLIDIGGSGDEVNMNLLCQPDSNNENDLNDIKSEIEYFSQPKTDNENDKFS